MNLGDKDNHSIISSLQKNFVSRTDPSPFCINSTRVINFSNKLRLVFAAVKSIIDFFPNLECPYVRFKFRGQLLLQPQINYLITLRVDNSIISIDCNITDGIISQVVNVLQEKSRFKNGPLRNSIINKGFLAKFAIQNSSKIFIAKKIQNTARYKT